MEFKSGWLPDPPDKRDFMWQAPLTVPEVKYAKLRNYGIPIFDQKRLGSCVSQATVFADEYVRNHNDNRWLFQGSRLQLYYESRAMIGTIMVDSGSHIRDAFKVLNKTGLCPEYMWQYDDGPFKFRMRPHQKCYDSAKLHKSIAYARVPQTEAGIKSAIVAGYPVVFGFMVYKSMMTPEVAKTGLVPMPKDGEEPIGGHAVIIVGFDSEKQLYIIRNSWGKGWGDNGHFYLPFDYVHDKDLADDFWVLYSTQ